MSHDELRGWVRILRDATLVGLGAFMLIHETLTDEPNPIIIGAALAMFGLPAALRLDSRRDVD